MRVKTQMTHCQIKRSAVLCLLAGVIASLAPHAAVAQVTARSAGLAQAYTALARGVDAPLFNPANLGLPDSQGLDTFTRIQAVAPDLPVVLFTGISDEELAMEALRMGAQDYLIKGQADDKLMVRSIRYALERKLGEF